MKIASAKLEVSAEGGKEIIIAQLNIGNENTNNKFFMNFTI